MLQINRNLLTPPWSGNPQKMNAVFDKTITVDLDSEFIFRKVRSHKLSNRSSGELCTLCGMNFAADPIQTQIPQFMGMGFSTINALDESSSISTITTIIQRPMDGSYWITPNHVFGEAIAVGMSEAK